MKKNILIMLFLVAANSVAQKGSDKIKIFENDLNHWDQSKNKKGTLQERMAFLGINAVSIAVIKNYKVEWVKAYGYADLAEKRKATPQTLFQAASISKSFNSLAQLKLVEEGKLGLNEDINTNLKTWQFPYDSVAKGKKITLALLLSHRAGLSVGGFPGYEKGKDLPTTLQILDGIKPANTKAVRSIYEPDTKFEYSGGGTTVSQLLLENITGMAYETYLQEKILAPLGMNSSSFHQPPATEKQTLLATGYNNEYEVTGKYHVYPEKAAAGLWTNPTDLAKYIIDTQWSILGKSNKIISKEMSIKRLNDHLGVFINDFSGAQYFRHSGRNEGFVCHYIGSFEGGNGLVVMTNGINASMLEEIINSIASLYNWKNFPLEASKESIVLTIRKTAIANVDQGIALYQKLKKEKPTVYNFSNENELNQLGYEFLQNNQINSALKIFSINITEFPNSANVYDSRGEAYFAKKEYALAQTDYLKVLELAPNHTNAKEMLLKIKAAWGK